MSEPNEPRPPAGGPPPGAPRPQGPPPVSTGLLLLWIFVVLVFVAGIGCTLLLVPFVLGGSADASGALGLIIMGAALFAFFRSLLHGRRERAAEAPTNQVLLFLLLIPFLATFVWAGGCLISVGGLG